MFVEDVHFDFGWMSAEDVGWRSLALALGDLAAKGAQPLWALTSIAMPKRWTVEQLTNLYAGMAGLAKGLKLAIAGGDMSTTEGPAVLSITVAGVGCVLRVADVRRAPGASVEDALTSGEEAELVCVGPAHVIAEAGLRPVGILTAGKTVKVVDARGAPVPLEKTGYDHFA